jgi:hypothetical protein
VVVKPASQKELTKEAIRHLRSGVRKPQASKVRMESSEAGSNWLRPRVSHRKQTSKVRPKLAAQRELQAVTISKKLSTSGHVATIRSRLELRKSEAPVVGLKRPALSQSTQPCTTSAKLSLNEISGSLSPPYQSAEPVSLPEREGNECPPVTHPIPSEAANLVVGISGLAVARTGASLYIVTGDDWGENTELNYCSICYTLLYSTMLLFHIHRRS